MRVKENMRATGEKRCAAWEDRSMAGRNKLNSCILLLQNLFCILLVYSGLEVFFLHGSGLVVFVAVERQLCVFHVYMYNTCIRRSCPTCFLSL